MNRWITVTQQGSGRTERRQLHLADGHIVAVATPYGRPSGTLDVWTTGGDDPFTVLDTPENREALGLPTP